MLRRYLFVLGAAVDRLGREFGAVLVDRVRLVALAVAAAVDRDRPEAGHRLQPGLAAQGAAPAARVPHPTVQQHDRFAGALGDVADLGAVRIEQSVLLGGGGVPAVAARVSSSESEGYGAEWFGS
jgi:hypothetical protein